MLLFDGGDEWVNERGRFDFYMGYGIGNKMGISRVVICCCCCCFVFFFVMVLGF